MGGGGHTRHFPEGRPYAPSARPLSTGVAADGTEDARLKFDSQRNESIFFSITMSPIPILCLSEIPI